MDYDYAKDVAIDQNHLDEEWLRQPVLFHRYSNLLVQATMARKRAEEKKKTVRSELTLEARKGGETLLGCKITDPVVEAYYRNHPNYKQVIEELLEAEGNELMLQNVVWAFNHRKSALENEVKLWCNNYFAGPKEPKEIAPGKRIAELSAAATSQKAREDLNSKRSQRSQRVK